MIIAVAPPHKNEIDNYTSWLTKRGFKYKILQKGDTLEGCQALVLCGGADVGTKPERDALETAWFKEAYGKMPVLGICRGLQIANVILGGTLHQDLNEEKTKHTSNKKDIAGNKPLSESSYHEVEDSEGTFLVNSRHHQGIEILAEGLEAVAWCKEDRLVEAATGENSLFVQWHPEREEVYDSLAEKTCSSWLLNSLID